MTQPHLPNLNDLGFQMISPSPPLQPYVQWYWYVDWHGSPGIYRREFMHAGARVGMIFNFEDELMLDGQTIGQTCLLDGTNTISRLMQFHGRIRAFGIQFKLGGAYALLAMPLFELMDSIIPLSDLDIQGIEQIGDQLRNASTAHEQVQIAERWLLDNVNLNAEVPSVIRASLTTLDRHQGQLAIPDVADSVYMSQRQLERLYKAQVGITPKQYARLVRVNRARLVLKTPDIESLAAVAAQVGYYDQAHFIREFKSVIGMTPNQYLKRHLARVKQKNEHP